VYRASMIERLMKGYKGNIPYLDAGDELQGGIESSKLISNGKIVKEFFDQAHEDAEAIGKDLDLLKWNCIVLLNKMTTSS
jgi:hypothetical protein